VIEDIVSSILDAENKARDIVAAAEREAEGILLRAESDIDAANAVANAYNKSTVSGLMQAADAEAEKAAADLFNEQKAVVDEEVKGSRQRLDAAVKYILENID
jgi:vacuolar-type H+-ATPase subunit E/Vma4